MSAPLELALVLCAKATLVLGVAWACQLALGDRVSAATRHLLWTCSIVALLALPLMSALLPAWDLPGLVRARESALPTAAAPAPSRPASAPARPDAGPSASPSAVEAASGTGVEGKGVAYGSALGLAAVLVYVLGALAVLSRLVLERVVVRRLERGGRAEEDSEWSALLVEACRTLGVRRRVRMLRSAESLSPMTWGTLRPTVLVPEAAREWSGDRRRAVLLHEVAHVARRDCLIQTLATVASALYWFHPGVWWVAHRMRVERELACDDAVLAAGAGATDYAGHLLEIARASQRMPAGIAALSMARPSMLEGRMRAILDRARNRAAPDRRTVTAGVVAATVLLVALAGVGVARPQGTPTLVEELRIGGTAPEYVFQNVDEIAVRDDGTIFVAGGERMPRVRMYDAGGRFVRNVGSAGDLAGQYRGIMGMRVTPAGELAIYDVFNQRISLFDRRGEFVRSIPSRVGGNWTGNDFHVDEEGNFYVFGVRSTSEARVTDQGEAVYSREQPPRNNRFYLKLSPRGAILDTLDMPLSNVRPQRGFSVMTPEGILRPFQNELLYDLSPRGYFVSGHASEYALDVQTGPAEVRRIQRDYTPIPVDGAERDEWQARADFYTRTLPPGSMSSRVPIPTVKPAFREIDVADDGRIWVRRYAVATRRQITTPRPADAPPALTWRDLPTFDVFEPDGRFRATVVVPENTRIAVRRGDHLWGTHTDSAGQVHVVRYRMD